MQGFQNIWICIFMIFLQISRHFQNLLFWETKEKERTFCAEAPGRHVLLADRPLAGLQSRGAAGGGIPAWGLTGGVGKVGEKRHGAERNPRVGSVGRGMAGRGSSAESSGRRRRLAAAAAVRWPGAAASGSGSTGGGQGS